MTRAGTTHHVTEPPPGEVAIVLHTHMPWVRRFGTWPVGEEWLFQAWAESWYPVTALLERLAEDGLRDVLTLSVSPTVAAQVDDPDLRTELGAWIAGQRWRAEEQRQWGRRHDSRLAALAPVHWRHFDRLLAVHADVEARGGLLAAWADLAAHGVIQVLGTAATHASLPLVDDPRLVDHQLAAGRSAHAAWLGGPPRGLWPPELGYRPRGSVADPTRIPTRVDRRGTPHLPRGRDERPGLEEHYAAMGLDHFVTDGSTLVAAARSESRRPGRSVDGTPRRDVGGPGAPDDVVRDGVLVGDSEVVAFGRDPAVSARVWSPTAGYPGHPDYRDWHALGGWDLHRSWRVTDPTLDVAHKDVWDPAATPRVVATHVDDFHGLLQRVLDHRPGDLVVSAWDTELFGHWWHEGPAWLEATLRRVADDPHLRTTTLASRRDRRPPTRRLDLPESSWGEAGGHASWVAPATRWMWERIRRAERAVTAVLDHLSPGDRALVLAEYGQLVASDWPFMVTRGTTGDYAAERVGRHDERLAHLLEAARVTSTPGLVAPDPPAMAWPVTSVTSVTSVASVASRAEDRPDHPVGAAGAAADRLRVLEVSWEFPPRLVGGLGRHVAALTRALADAGHAVTTVARGHPDATDHEVVDGVEVHRVDDPPGLDRRTRLVEWVAALNARLLATGAHHARHHDVDVVHVHDWVTAPAGIALKEAFDLPLVATVHATEHGRHQGHLPGAMNRYIHQVEWWLTRRADRVITCSASMRDSVVSLFDVDRSRIDLVPNGVDLREFADDVDPLHRATTRLRWAPDGEHLVVFVGRLEYEKGVHTMLAALPSLRARAGPVRFVVAGVGTCRDDLVDDARRRGLADVVAFPGFVPADDLRALYAAADVVVAPSLYEPFGLVVLEALGCGTAVVVSDTGGLGELARAGAGIAVPAGDHAAWAAAVGELLEDRDRAAAVVRRGRRVAADSHDWSAVAAATAATLRRAAADPDRCGHDHDLRRDLAMGRA